MAGDELFGELPERARPRADAVSRGTPRLREPRRDQIELQAVDIESLIGEDHAVRVIWAYVRLMTACGTSRKSPSGSNNVRGPMTCSARA